MTALTKEGAWFMISILPDRLRMYLQLLRRSLLFLNSSRVASYSTRYLVRAGLMRNRWSSQQCTVARLLLQLIMLPLLEHTIALCCSIWRTSLGIANHSVSRLMYPAALPWMVSTVGSVLFPSAGGRDGALSLAGRLPPRLETRGNYQIIKKIPIQST
jgi:hypothetical protein